MPKEFLSSVENGTTAVALSETVVKDFDDNEIPVRFSGSILKDGDDTIGAAAFFQDLREVKRLEKEKLESERLAAVGQTVAQLAHGIKNILTGLRGGMYVIKSGMKSGFQQRIDQGWSMLDRNVERMTVLVRGFLDYSKKRVPKVQPIAPVEIAAEIFALYSPAAKQEGVALQLDAEQEIASANMDPSGIHSCLANLVGNAVDACKSSKKDECTVCMRVSEEDEIIIFEVSDTGCGMEPDIKEKVFTNFFTTKGLEGTGLGLLVTRKIVEEHGGQIFLETEPGIGSTFRMEFPRIKLPDVD
jgi:signal transduction histidine kinase